MERLHKVLAARGVASRRKAEQMIAEGRVTVDGEVVQTVGARVDPETARISVDGRPVRREPKRYIMLNKPPGYITTASDERGRRTVLDLIDVPERVVPVGRLDRPTSGLLLLTNDGELAHRVMHPRFELEKEYEVLLDGNPPRPVLDRLADGVSIDGEKVRPSEVRAVRNEPDGTVLRVVIHEGRNRIVRRMMESIGYSVLRLERVRLGPLVIQGVPRGSWRELTAGELEQLNEVLKMDEPAPDPSPRQRVSQRSRQERDRTTTGPPKPGGTGTKRRDERRSGSGHRRPVRDRDRRSSGVRQEHRRGGGRSAT